MGLFARPSPALLLSAAMCFAAAHAVAQEPAPDPATEAYSQGASFAAEGRWAEARAKFAQAVAVRATPIGLFNLAQAERNLGLLAAAKRHFVAARTLAKREAAEDLARLADDALAELNPKVPRVVLLVPKDAARVAVRVDGQPVEVVDDTVDLDPGKHRLEITAAGEQPIVREIDLAEGERASVEVRFPRAVAAAPSAAPLPPKTEPVPARRTRSGPPTGAIVVGGAGIAALVTGSVLHLYRDAKLDEAASGCVRTGEGWRCPTSLETDADHRKLRDRADTAEAWRNVLFAVGGAAVVGGGLWWALDSGPEKSVALGINPDPRAASARVRVRF